MRQTVAAVVAWTAAAVLLLWAADWYTSLPIVDRSTATGECVDVDDPAHRYTCQTVPDWPALTRWVP